MRCAYVVWSNPSDPVAQVTYFKLKADADAFASTRLYEGRPAKARRTTLHADLARRKGLIK